MVDSPEAAGGKAAWEATPERREASLKERKAQMVLAARKYVYFLTHCLSLYLSSSLPRVSFPHDFCLGEVCGRYGKESSRASADHSVTTFDRRLLEQQQKAAAGSSSSGIKTD